MKSPSEAADELIGTCQSLHEVVQDGETDDPAWCLQFDEITMSCETCGWWVDSHEIDRNGNCEQCQEESDE